MKIKKSEIESKGCQLKEQLFAKIKESPLNAALLCFFGGVLYGVLARPLVPLTIFLVLGLAVLWFLADDDLAEGAAASVPDSDTAKAAQGDVSKSSGKLKESAKSKDSVNGGGAASLN